MLSGVYFMLLPSGGYQGGRNPWYGVTILFSRHTWDALHTWAGVAMIGAVVIHVAVHWSWVVMMARRSVNALTSRGSTLSRGTQLRLALNVLVGLSFLVTAVTGVYLLFAPSSGGGHSASSSVTFLFSRATWDLIHTWAGVAVIVVGVAHLVIHWQWVKNVTRRLALSLRPRPRQREALAEG